VLFLLFLSVLVIASQFYSQTNCKNEIDNKHLNPKDYHILKEHPVLSHRYTFKRYKKHEIFNLKLTWGIVISYLLRITRSFRKESRHTKLN